MKANQNSKKKGLGQTRFIILMLMPGFLLVALFTYFPAIKGVTMAFQNYTLYTMRNVKWIGFDNFQKIFKNREFLMAIPNTLRWVFFSLFFQFTIGFTLALFLKRKFHGRGLYQGSICFPWAISGFLIGITFYIIIVMLCHSLSAFCPIRNTRCSPSSWPMSGMASRSSSS